MSDGYAEFKVGLPSGGRFYAAWPKGMAADDMLMARAMLEATLEMWTAQLRRMEAGELEYASWMPVSPPL